jgi:hypothetical protein
LLTNSSAKSHEPLPRKVFERTCTVARTGRLP